MSCGQTWPAAVPCHAHGRAVLHHHTEHRATRGWCGGGVCRNIRVVLFATSISNHHQMMTATAVSSSTAVVLHVARVARPVGHMCPRPPPRPPAGGGIPRAGGGGGYSSLPPSTADDEEGGLPLAGPGGRPRPALQVRRALRVTCRRAGAARGGGWPAVPPRSPCLCRCHGLPALLHHACRLPPQGPV